LPILDWHEIVNDEMGDLFFAITYCPLTGTGIGWNRKLGAEPTTFGVSGLLYNSNLMPYDRQSSSTWSQQQLECVNGTRRGEHSENFYLIETTLATWRKSFPSADIMNGNTGFDRTYNFYPYGNYRTTPELIFPVSNEDQRLPAKERVLGVLSEDEQIVFRFNKAGKGIELINTTLGDKQVIVLRSFDDQFITAFIKTEDLQFESLQDQFPAVMKDNIDNMYDLAGRIISGPNKGDKLERAKSFMGYWFSWPSFYPDIEIYEG